MLSLQSFLREGRVVGLCWANYNLKDLKKWLRERLRGTPQVEKVAEDTDIRTDSGSSGDEGDTYCAPIGRSFRFVPQGLM